MISIMYFLYPKLLVRRQSNNLSWWGKKASRRPNRPLEQQYFRYEYEYTYRIKWYEVQYSTVDSVVSYTNRSGTKKSLRVKILQKRVQQQ